MCNRRMDKPSLLHLIGNKDEDGVSVVKTGESVLKKSSMGHVILLESGNEFILENMPKASNEAIKFINAIGML